MFIKALSAHQDIKGENQIINFWSFFETKSSFGYVKGKEKAKRKLFVVLRGMILVLMHGKKVAVEYHSIILQDNVREVTAVSSQSPFGNFSRQSPKLA
jgi:hypothetical protein